MSRLFLAILLPLFLSGALTACAANNSSNEQDLSFAFMQPAPAADEPIASARGTGSCALFRDALDRAEAKLSETPRGF